MTRELQAWFFIVVSTLAVSALAQLELSWVPCDTMSTDVSRCTIKYPIPNDVNTECGTAQTPYIPASPMSFNITYSANTGGFVELEALKMFQTMNRTVDVYIPANRGYNLQCPGSTSMDHLVKSVECQTKYNDQYGIGLLGFTVDNMAIDHLNLIKSMKAPVYVMGKGVGSYIVHRMMQIEPNIVDAVILDGVCAGPYCNASTWDIQRNILGKQLLSEFDSMPTNSSEARSKYVGWPSPEVLYSDLFDTIVQNTYVCGWEGQARTNPETFKQRSTFMLFDPIMRPVFLAAMLKLRRCAMVDYGPGMAMYDTGVNTFHQYSTCKNPSDASVIGTHVLISELSDRPAPEELFLLFSQRFALYANPLVKSGWVPYPQSQYRNSVATYSRPLLMLNSEYDPKSPIASARLFASNFTAPNQQLITFAGQDILPPVPPITCSESIISQFIACPDCQLNTDCATKVVMNFDSVNGTSSNLYYNVWGNIFIPPPPIDLAYAITYAALYPLPFIVLFFVIVFRNHPRIRSRLFGPHLGLMYVVAHHTTQITDHAGHNLSLQYRIVGLVLQNVLICTAATVIILQIIRFFTLNRIYYNMYMKKEKSLGTRILRLLASPFFFIAAIVALTLIWAVYGALMAFFTYRSGSVLLFFIYSTVGYTGGLCVVTFILSIIDLGLHFKRKGCNLKNYSDPMLYRVDCLLMIPLIIFGVCGSVYLELTFNLVADQVFTVLLCLFFGGNACIGCIIEYFRNKKTRQTSVTNPLEPEANDEDLIVQLMRHPIGFEYASRYWIKEWALENCWAYKALDTIISEYYSYAEDVRQQRLKEFYELYIMDNSDMQTNVPAAFAIMFKNLVDGGDVTAASEEEIVSKDDDRETLIKVLNIIMGNLLDTFNRFRMTSEYAECLEEMRLSPTPTKELKTADTSPTLLEIEETTQKEQSAAAAEI